MTRNEKTSVLPLALILLVLFSGLVQAGEDRAAELEARAREVARKMAKARQLEFKRDVTIGVKTEKELLAFLESSIDEELPPGKIEAIQKAYSKMGLLPPDMDLRKTFLDMMTSQVGGFYNPKTKRLFLIDRRSTKKKNPTQAMMEMVLKRFGMSSDDLVTAHELTHALQDQHFGLEKMDRVSKGNDDRILAMKCVVEGDATVAMYEPLFEKMPMARGMMRMQNLDSSSAAMGPEMKNVPDILKVPLTFPYIAGAKLVGKIKEEGGWEAVNALFEDLPLSTEQVLHPEKYSGKRDDPVFIEFDDEKSLPPGGWELLEANSFGELGTRIFLDEILPKRLAHSAAKGWDGDRFAAYGRGDDVFFFWYTTWDSEREAEEFATACVKRMRKRYGLEGTGGDEGGDFSFVKGREHGRIVTRGLDVVVVEGLDAGATSTLVEKLFRVVRKKGPKDVTERPDPVRPAPRGEINGDGFTVEPPRGWNARKADTYGRIVMEPARGGGRIEVGVLSFPERKGVGELAKLLVSELGRKLDSFEHLGTEAASFQDREARWIRFRGEDPGTGKPFRYAMHVVLKGGQAFVLSVISPARAFKKTHGAGRRVLESFRFE
ncbi:MAG: hypothetical protein ACYTFG_02390 [Planctomycetota bacterium]|jgi:hypothetical protein